MRSESSDVMSGLGDLLNLGKIFICPQLPPVNTTGYNCSNHLEIVVIIVSVFQYLGKSKRNTSSSYLCVELLSTVYEYCGATTCLKHNAVMWSQERQVWHQTIHIKPM